MAYSYIDSSFYYTDQNVSSVSISSGADGDLASVSDGDLIIVCTHFFSGGTDPGATITDDIGNTYTEAPTSPVIGQSNRTLRYFYTFSSGGGSNVDVTADWGSSASYKTIVAVQYDGVSAFQVGSDNTQNTPGTGTDGITSTNATPTSQPALQFGFSMRFSGNENEEPLAGTGFTGRNAADTTVPSLGYEDRTLTSTAATAATFTAQVNNTYDCCQMIFTETAVGGSAVPIIQSTHRF